MDYRGVIRLEKPSDQIVDLVDANEILTKHCILWRGIGLNLGLTGSVLDGIEYDHNTLRKRFEMTLKMWLRMDQDKATWGVLELALTNANRAVLSLNKLLSMPPKDHTSTSVPPLHQTNQPKASHDQMDASGVTPAPKADMTAAIKKADENQDKGKSVQQDTTDGDDLPLYKMDSNPRGLGIIINNKNIKGMESRDGAEVDGKTLEELFSHLCFKAKIYEDLTADDMEKNLKDVAKEDHSTYDCLLVAILSHGEDEEKVYGTDKKTISLIQLLKLFDGSNCKSLISKPKIFFVQACRGDEIAKSVDATDGPSSDEEDKTDSGGITLPNMSDYLIAYSTDRNNKAFRNNREGSYFIVDLNEVLRKMAENEQLIDMLTEVNRKMAERTFRDGKCKQQPHFVSALRKKLYLKQPIPQDDKDGTLNLDLEPEMIDLYNIVVPRIKEYWNKVAFALKFKPADVKKIREDHNRDPKKCCEQVFEDLLEADHASPITWATILDAIGRVEELTTAREEIIKELK